MLRRPARIRPSMHIDGCIGGRWREEAQTTVVCIASRSGRVGVAAAPVDGHRRPLFPRSHSFAPCVSLHHATLTCLRRCAQPVWSQSAVALVGQGGSSSPTQIHAVHCTAHKHSHEQQAHTCTRTYSGVRILRSAFRRASLSAAADQSGRSAAATSRARSRVCISTRRRHVSQRHDRWRACNARHAGGCSRKRDGKILRRTEQQVQTDESTVPTAAVAVPARSRCRCARRTFPSASLMCMRSTLCPICVCVQAWRDAHKSSTGSACSGESTVAPGRKAGWTGCATSVAQPVLTHSCWCLVCVRTNRWRVRCAICPRRQPQG